LCHEQRLVTNLVPIFDDLHACDFVTPIVAKAVVGAFRSNIRLESLPEFRVFDSSEPKENRWPASRRLVLRTIISVKVINGEDRPVFLYGEDVALPAKNQILPCYMPSSSTLYVFHEKICAG
jgi:hypothetical protein